MSERDSTAQVEYRPIPKCPGYRVGNDGTIWSCRPRNGKGRDSSWRLLKQKVNDRGYCEVRLQVNGKPRYFRVSRLVAAAFVPNPLNKPEVNHADGNKLNNASGNLEWVTRSENERHAFDAGLKTGPRGEWQHCCKLSTNDVERIRLLLASGERVTALARAFGVHQTTISDIKLGRSWAYQETAGES